ncbi:MAG: iron ABC transporter permease [Cyclobacteriaceae bacterium]
MSTVNQPSVGGVFTRYIKTAALKINNMQGKITIRWTLLLLSLFLLFALNLSLGSVPIPLSEIFRILFTGQSSQPVWTDIVWDFRMTKALTCVLAGSALAAAGLQMQTLFRNALAGPDVLGLSSGASLAVALIFLNPSTDSTLVSAANPLLVSIAASLGCAAVLIIMLLVARKLQDHVSLLIVGLMVGAATASIVSVLQYLSKAEAMQVYILWTFGSLGGLNWIEIQILAIALIIGVGIAFSQIKSLNAWLLGDHYAMSLGVNITSARVMIILSSSILTGAVTAFCGPLAFVGLAVPHLTKLVISSHNHKTLIPAVLAGGAALLLFCDIIAHLPGSTYVLPVNALTALIGAPVVIWIIIRNKKLRV